MRVALCELSPNPFKKQINGGKLNQEKIDKLKESIKSDGFWSGIMCRKVGGEYQIPFGHHRVESAKQVLGDKYVIDIPILKLSDEQMVRMLANENSMQNEEYAIYQVDTVVMAQNYLKEFRPQRERKSTGRPPEVGSVEHISEFLGEKNWQKTKVSQYLRMHEQLHPTILRNLRNSPNTGSDEAGFTVSHARSIVRLGKKEQKDVYDEIRDKDLNHREMYDVVSSIDDGESIKDAVSRVVKNRDSREIIKNIVAPIEGQKIVLMCDSLITSIQSYPLKSYPPKGQQLLKQMYEKLIDILKKEMED